MADVNGNAHVDQAPTMAPPTRTNDQILPHIRWFWDTIRYDKTTRCYKCQLDEQWFDLSKDTLKDALHITPVNNNNAFSSPLTSDALINFINDLDKKNLAQHTYEKKKATLIVIPSVRFTNLIIYYLQSKHKFHPILDSPLYLPNEEPALRYLKFSAKGTKREVFGMPIPDKLITADIQGEPYYKEYLEKVAKHQRYLAGEKGSDPDSLALKPAKATNKSKPSALKADLRLPVTKPASSQQPKPKPAPANSLRSVDEFVDEGIPKKEPRFDDEEADVQRALEESLKSIYDAHRGPLPSVVIIEPDSGKYQPLPEVQGKGKEKVTDEQVSLDLLTLQTPKKKSPADQFIFQRRTSTPTESSGHDESSSLYVELGLTNSKGPASSTRTLSSLQYLAKDLSFGDLFFNDKPSEADNEKTIAKTEVESMETNSYKAHEDHMMLYEALERSMNRDQTDELLKDLAEASKKKKNRRDSSKMPPGSSPYQPPPPLPPPGPSRTSGSLRAFGSSQKPPPPPPPLSNNQEDLHMDDDMAPDAQVHSSVDEDIENARIPKNNWAFALTSTYSSLLEDSLLVQTGDMAMFMDWFSKRQGTTELKPQDLEGPAFKLVKVYHPNVIHLQYQMEECHKLLTDSMDDSIIRHNVSKPLPLSGPPGQMKAAYYPDVSLEQMVPDQMWIEKECKYDIAAIIEVFSMCGYDYMKKIILRRADLNEQIIVERDFKYLYLSDFKDLYLLNLQDMNSTLPERGCNIGNVPTLKQLALKDEDGFVIHLGSWLH
nr:histone deacetylase 14 [Tanacetum cinerariifolium]